MLKCQFKIEQKPHVIHFIISISCIIVIVQDNVNRAHVNIIL